jgi:predicted nucleic acid-binding protein
MPEPERLVVADTSPLLYLHQAKQLHLLRALYGPVVVPSAVRVELTIGRARGHDAPDVSSIEWIRTLGVLLKAKSAGLLDAVRPILETLRACGMRIHDELEQRILQAAGEVTER